MSFKMGISFNPQHTHPGKLSMKSPPGGGGGGGGCSQKLGAAPGAAPDVTYPHLILLGVKF